MFSAIARRIFGSVNDRMIKEMQPIVIKINDLEEKFQSFSDEELKEQTNVFKALIAEGASLDDLLVDAFATVREASKRVFGMRHFDVQLKGAITLHRGMIAEMRTGEGKTLMSTLAAYLNALEGNGVHIVTVNDYLAKRDAEWMGRLYNFLGLSVECVINGLDDAERKCAYNADITYGTNNEFGFDYLRDNMKYEQELRVQRPFNFAIIDEVDSILIDEARTPLIISGPTEDNSDLYEKINKLMSELEPLDFDKDEKARNVLLTDDGIIKIESLLKSMGLMQDDTNLYDMENIALVHHVNQALKAHKLFTIDVDYIVKDNKIMIIDEFTGRMMEGRRYSEGLHQALEAKEGVKIQNENQTLASITFQNYFRLYPKISGMTGTAMTEAAEFRDIYSLDVLEIPTNIPLTRIDEDDEVYRTNEEKYHAILEVILDCYNRSQPILVGTISIEKSEYISKLLTKAKIEHKVLNARYHEQEAFIIAQAGRAKAVTIATNMAGRGTDIMLGGNPDMMFIQTEGKVDLEEIKREVAENKKVTLEAGGLYVLGTERHESRRIDNQLRGRSGRQGDPGRTKFFLSLEDDLMRIFASERMSVILQKLGLKDGEAITHPMISRALERAQQKVEAYNYDIRKNLLKFDDVMNDQRKVIYDQRLEIMEADDIKDTVADMYEEVNSELISKYIPNKTYIESWDLEGLTKEVYMIYHLSIPFAEWALEDNAEQEILLKLNAEVAYLFNKKEEIGGVEVMRLAEKRYLLLTLDYLWKEHLHTLDHLRQGINLRAYGQRDPLSEYKRESFILFEEMLSTLRFNFIEKLAHLNIHPDMIYWLTDKLPEVKMSETRSDPAFAKQASADPSWARTGRNEQCPCGSGLKYKNCHGKLV